MNHKKAEAETKPASEAGSAADLQPAAPSKDENVLLRRFQISMSKDDIAREIDTLAVEYSQKVKMPGFRQGKVPVDVVKKVYKQALREEVIQQAVSKLAFERIEKDKIAVASEPYVEKMEDKEDEDFRGRYRGRNAPGDHTSRLGHPAGQDPGRRPERRGLRRKQAGRADPGSQQKIAAGQGRPIAENDLVLLLVQSADATGKKKWPRQETYFMMNRESESEITGLYDELLGKKHEEKFTLQRSYDASAPKKAWAGKKIEHQVEIKAVYELKKPEMDETFLKSLGMKSVEDFKKKLKEEYEHRQEHQKEEKIMDGIYEKLLETCQFPVPRSLQEQEVARRLTQNKRPLNFKDDEEKAKFKEMMFAQAEKSVRLSLILERVREQYHIEVNAQDLDKEYAHLAQHHSLPEKEIRKYYGEEKREAELKDHLLNAKINEFIKEKIKVKEV